MRVDAFKIFMYSNRGQGALPISDMMIWNNITNLVSYLGIFSNLCLMIFC